MISRHWFGPIALLIGIALVAAIMTYFVTVSPRHWYYLYRPAYVSAICASALALVGLAKLFLRLRHGYWKALPSFDIPRSWESVLETAVYVGVFAALAVLAARLISG